MDLDENYFVYVYICIIILFPDHYKCIKDGC